MCARRPLRRLAPSYAPRAAAHARRRHARRTNAKSSSLAHFEVGKPASKVSRNGFYVSGETAEFRNKCMDGDWDNASLLMANNLVKKFAATPEYAAWWANETVERYKRNGAPAPPPRRAKAAEGDAPRAPGRKAKRAAFEAAAEPPATMEYVLDMVRRTKANLSLVDGTCTITINGREVVSCPADDVATMHDKMLRVTTVRAVAATFATKAAEAAAVLDSFLTSHARELEIVGLTAEEFKATAGASACAAAGGDAGVATADEEFDLPPGGEDAGEE